MCERLDLIVAKREYATDAIAAKPATDVLKIVYDLALLFRSVTPSRQRNGHLVNLAGELNRYWSSGVESSPA